MSHKYNISDSCGGSGCGVKIYNLPREEYRLDKGVKADHAPMPNININTRIAKKPAHLGVKFRKIAA